MEATNHRTERAGRPGRSERPGRGERPETDFVRIVRRFREIETHLRHYRVVTDEASYYAAVQEVETLRARASASFGRKEDCSGILARVEAYEAALFRAINEWRVGIAGRGHELPMARSPRDRS